MRVWVGNRIDDGTTAVFAFDQPARPSLDEIGELLRELRQLNDDPATDLARQTDFVARKQDLIERIEADENPVPAVVPIHPAAGDRPFDWGEDGPGAKELAWAVLTDAVGDPPPEQVVERYVNDVVASLPKDQFRLDAADINEWLLTQDLFVEAELAAHRGGLDPGPSGPPSLRVVAPDGAPTGDATTDPATASALIAACEQAWADIQHHHPDVPHAVVVLGSGVERGRLVKLGHWWGGRWLADGEVRGEVLLAGEALHLPAEQVFEVLLHEAAHGINAALDVKDASRGGRYHNKRFRTMAEQVGLDVSVMKPYGWARTALTAETAERYADAIDRLGDAMRLARTIERGTQLGPEADQERTGRTGGAEQAGEQPEPRRAGAAMCGCGRRMRMAPSVLAAGPVLCGLCGNEFRVGRDASRSAGPGDPQMTEGTAVVDDTFVTRRQEALAHEHRTAPSAQAEGRLAAFLAAARESGHGAHPAVIALAHRYNLLVDARGTAGLDAPIPNLTPIQREGLVELVVAGDKPGDWAVASWYQSRGTEHEQPMVAGTMSEAGRRRNLARAMLKADGTLHGPAIEVLGREFLAGEQVVVGPTGVRSLDLDPGIPGTVDQVDPAGQWLDVDFPTAGHYRLPADGPDAVALAYGYSQVAQGLDRVDLRTVDIRTADLHPAVEVAPVPAVALPEIDL
ncbi:MAG: DUF6166 domain-containing protein [Nocardioidaceae bacterium]